MTKDRSKQMLKLPLHAIAHGRAGDKGNVSNISLIAYRDEAWSVIHKNVTESRVFELFRHLGLISVKRYELPKLKALNFVLDGILDGGVNSSRNVDRHGKSLSYVLLSRLILDVPIEALPPESPYLDPQFAWKSA